MSPSTEHPSMPATATETSPLLQHNARGYTQAHTQTHTNTHLTSDAETNHHNDNDGGEDNSVSSEEPTTKFLIAVNGSVWVGVFFAALDTTVVATLTGPISSSFDSLSLLSWLATGYLIANSACQPLSGKLTDIFGRRAGLMFSNFFFGVGTLICGLAPNAQTIIAGRVIAGIGGGGLTCIATFLGSDLVPLRKRGLWQGFGNLVFGLGMGLGGIFGGLCADRLSWRWAFLLQIPFIVVSAVAVWFLLRVPVGPQQVSSKKEALKKIDFLGAALLVVSLVLLLLGLNTGGNQLPWNHPLIITSLVLAGVTMAAFLYVESTPSIVPEPVIPVSLVIRTRTVLMACFCNWFATMAAFMALYYIPFYLQIILQTTATSAGLRTIPFAVGTSLGSLGCGAIMRATGRYYMLLAVTMALFILGSALICTFDKHTPAWHTYIYVLPLGIGYGSMLTITLVAMISAVPHEFQAVITAASYAFRSTGSTIGITIASAVFQNVLTDDLKTKYGTLPNSDEVTKRIRDSLDEISRLPPGWDADVIRDVFMHAFKGAFYSGLGLAVLSALVGLGMREHVLYRHLARK